MTERRRISVVCPSRLQSNPRPGTGSLLVERAIESVRRQSVWGGHDWELIVAVDPEVAAPEHRLIGVKVVAASAAGQAAAMNAGARAATGDLLAFIEDDDVWHRRKIELQVDALRERSLRRRRFVSSTQLEVDADGNHIRVHDFATTSGWLMEREVWQEVGPFDESYRWHIDNEWLARLNRSGVPRVHLVDHARPVREQLLYMARYSHLAETDQPAPLVSRTLNPDGAMNRIARDPEYARQSRAEHSRIEAAFGEGPW